jgi:hypothetical protein
MKAATKQSHKKTPSPALRRVARRSGNLKTPASFTKENHTPVTTKRIGRPPGSENKISRDFKEAIKHAAALAGDIRGKEWAQRELDGYCMHLAMNDQKLFVALIRSIIPAEIQLSAKHIVDITYGSREEVARAAEAQGLPDHIFPVRFGSGKTIEHQPLELLPPDEVEVPAGVTINEVDETEHKLVRSKLLAGSTPEKKE